MQDTNLAFDFQIRLERGKKEKKMITEISEHILLI